MQILERLIATHTPSAPRAGMIFNYHCPCGILRNKRVGKQTKGKEA
jgi:hypothetical protein